MNPGILVAAITGLAFVAMAVYLAYQSQRIQYPAGHQEFLRFGEQEVRVITSPKLPYRALRVEFVRMALQATAQEWVHWSWLSFSAGNPKLVVYICESDSPYLEDRRGHLHGVQTYAKSKIGRKREPMLVVEDVPDPDPRVELKRVAGLVIHEAGHLLAIALRKHPDSLHRMPEVWADVSPTSFEARALQDLTFRIGP